MIYLSFLKKLKYIYHWYIRFYLSSLFIKMLSHICRFFQTFDNSSSDGSAPPESIYNKKIFTSYVKTDPDTVIIKMFPTSEPSTSEPSSPGQPNQPNQPNQPDHPDHPKLAELSELPEETVYARYIGRILGKPHILMQKSRPLAYASEVGESFRPIVPRWIVNSAYGISIGYVIVDTMIHTYNVNQILKNRNNSQSQKHLAINFIDKAIWHTFASMILPAVTIHSIVKYSGICLKHELDHMSFFKITNPFNDEAIKAKNIAQIAKYSRWGSVFIGLASIPFIIHPLDHLTDYVMDKTMRQLYPGQLIDTYAHAHAHQHHHMQ